MGGSRTGPPTSHIENRRARPFQVCAGRLPPGGGGLGTPACPPGWALRPGWGRLTCGDSAERAARTLDEARDHEAGQGRTHAGQGRIVCSEQPLCEDLIGCGCALWVRYPSAPTRMRSDHGSGQRGGADFFDAGAAHSAALSIEKPLPWGICTPRFPSKRSTGDILGYLAVAVSDLGRKLTDRGRMVGPGDPGHSMAHRMASSLI